MRYLLAGVLALAAVAASRADASDGDIGTGSAPRAEFRSEAIADFGALTPAKVWQLKGKRVAFLVRPRKSLPDDPRWVFECEIDDTRMVGMACMSGHKRVIGNGTMVLEATLRVYYFPACVNNAGIPSPESYELHLLDAVERR